MFYKIFFVLECSLETLYGEPVDKKVNVPGEEWCLVGGKTVFYNPWSNRIREVAHDTVIKDCDDAANYIAKLLIEDGNLFPEDLVRNDLSVLGEQGFGSIDASDVNILKVEVYKNAAYTSPAQSLPDMELKDLIETREFNTKNPEYIDLEEGGIIGNFNT